MSRGRHRSPAKPSRAQHKAMPSARVMARRRQTMRRNLNALLLSGVFGGMLAVCLVNMPASSASTSPVTASMVSPSRVVPASSAAVASRSFDRVLLSENVGEDTGVAQWDLGESSAVDVAMVTVEPASENDGMAIEPQDDEPAVAENSTTEEQENKKTEKQENSETEQQNNNTAEKQDTLPAITITNNPANTYPWGQCTWYAYERRTQLNLPASTSFGNAGQWAYNATAQGYIVTNTPTEGAIIVFSPGQYGADGYYGHVGIVETVNDDGSILISESNCVGLGVVSYREFTALQAAGMQYIR